jgi:hypothetical protein
MECLLFAAHQTSVGPSTNAPANASSPRCCPGLFQVGKRSARSGSRGWRRKGGRPRMRWHALVHGGSWRLQRGRHCPENDVPNGTNGTNGTRQGLAAWTNRMTSAGLEHAVPCPSIASTVVMEIGCKARANPVLSELSQRSDGVLKRCGEGKRAALASFSCGIDSRYHA